jgi:hypothetical protein
MSKIRIELRKDVINKKGKAPIRFIYQIEGQRKFYATNITLHPDNWDANSQTIIYLPKREAKNRFPGLDFDLNFLDNSEVEARNTELAVIKKDIKDIEADFERRGIKYNVEMVIEALNESKEPTTKKQEPNNLLFDFIDKYIHEHQSTRVKGSLTVYKSI